MSRPNSRTIVRAWNKDGYHKDILLIDSEQVRMSDCRCEEASACKMFAGNMAAPRMVIDPKKFPEMFEFEVIVEAYKE